MNTPETPKGEENLKEQLAARSESLDRREDLANDVSREEDAEKARELSNEKIPALVVAIEAAKDLKAIAGVLENFQAQGVRRLGDRNLSEMIQTINAWSEDKDGAVRRMADPEKLLMIRSNLGVLGGLADKAAKLMLRGVTDETMADRLADRRERLDREERGTGTILQGPGSTSERDTKAA